MDSNPSPSPWRESLLEVTRQNIAGWCQQTFCFLKFVDNTQQCFAFTPQANFPAHNLNFYWWWRWWDRIHFKESQMWLQKWFWPHVIALLWAFGISLQHCILYIDFCSALLVLLLPVFKVVKQCASSSELCFIFLFSCAFIISIA